MPLRDRIRKLEEYKRLPTLRMIILIEPNLPQVLLLRREEGGVWHDELLRGLDATIPPSNIGAALALSDIYEGVPLDQAS